jgi:alkylhydroperoxidase family enzyme
MEKAEALHLYNENWDREFTTIDNLYARIKVLAENGCYQCLTYIDSRLACDRVKDQLREDGFDVEYYNKNQSMLQISWGN